MHVIIWLISDDLAVLHACVLHVSSSSKSSRSERAKKGDEEEDVGSGHRCWT